MFYKYNSNLVSAAKDNRKAMTKFEKKFWYLIETDKTGYTFRRQKPIGNFIVDFYCEKLKVAIEIDGEYHNENGYIERDRDRSNFLESLGIKVLRYKNEDVGKLTTEKIKQDIQPPQPLVVPPRVTSPRGASDASAFGVKGSPGGAPRSGEGVALYVVLGPTASGKSDRAVELAIEHNGEVINADSRQVYKHLDVCTGKITEEEMKGVRHHLLSYVEPPHTTPSVTSLALGATSPKGGLNAFEFKAPLGELSVGLKGLCML